MFKTNFENLLCVTHGGLSYFYKSEFYSSFPTYFGVFHFCFYYFKSTPTKSCFINYFQGVKRRKRWQAVLSEEVEGWRRRGHDGGSVNPSSRLLLWPHCTLSALCILTLSLATVAEDLSLWTTVRKQDGSSSKATENERWAKPKFN